MPKSYLEGFSAGFQDLLASVNPYATGSTHYQLWLDGYHAGRERRELGRVRRFR